jgi:transcription-repair coupling factor (superfamily II helicase)
MPNVNTLIVNDAHKFGLAQLYQIRGRVGRSTRQAYAYLLVPPEERLSDESRARLEVISAHQELGAGFQIARYDLEIRGAGNLLGGEQSGKIAEIGLDLYTEMLEQAIAEVKGHEHQQKVDTEIKIPFAAMIPSAYISEEGLRLDVYKRLFSVENADELEQLRSEVQDRFGALPSEVELLMGVAKLKWMLRVCNAIALLRNQFGDCEIKFSSLNESQIANITKIIAENPRVYRISPDFKFIFAIKSPWDSAIAKQLVFMDELIAKLEPLVNEMDSNNDS